MQTVQKPNPISVSLAWFELRRRVICRICFRCGGHLVDVITGKAGINSIYFRTWILSRFASDYSDRFHLKYDAILVVIGIYKRSILYMASSAGTHCMLSLWTGNQDRPKWFS